ncbi:hypothetical protein GPALN_012103 [Globodera pallida]|nr:hypothetical protein GPALN_012103 [Globodera pallida]
MSLRFMPAELHFEIVNCLPVTKLPRTTFLVSAAYSKWGQKRANIACAYAVEAFPAVYKRPPLYGPKLIALTSAGIEPQPCWHRLFYRINRRPTQAPKASAVFTFATFTFSYASTLPPPHFLPSLFRSGQHFPLIAFLFCPMNKHPINVAFPRILSIVGTRPLTFLAK